MKRHDRNGRSRASEQTGTSSPLLRGSIHGEGDSYPSTYCLRSER